MVLVQTNVHIKYSPLKNQVGHDLGPCILVKGLYQSLVPVNLWPQFIANPDFPDWSFSTQLIDVIMNCCKFEILHIYVDEEY